MSSNIRKRGTNSWLVQIEFPADPVTGRRRRRYLTVRGTKKEAQQAASRVEHERDTGLDFAPGKLTVGEYLQRWLRDYAEQNVRASTLAGYRSAVRRHLAPQLGALKLAELRPAHIQHCYATLLESGLAPRTVLIRHRILHEALEHAVRWQLIARNPADAATAPRPPRTEMAVASEEEVRALLRTARGEPIEMLVHLALATGARIGELLGLKWSDVDLTRGEMIIQRTAYFLAGEGIVMNPPKTHRSRRPIALSTETCRLLRDHRARQHERRLKLGPLWADHDLVFPSEVGTPMDAANVRRVFKRITKACGLERLRFHDLRHTAATLMLRAGVHPKVVSERLGHSSIAITLDTYSHVLPDMQQSAAGVLDAVLATS